MTTHFLGDNAPRKSNFDPDLARKVTKYYEEHPEELIDPPEAPPVPTDAIKQGANNYFLMPRASTYALGVSNLRDTCVVENNQNHPQFTIPYGSLIYRPLTFKENIQARVENYETTHNLDGSGRTVQERNFLITESSNDSCTAIAYKAGTTKFKVVPLSPLITLNHDFKEDFLPVDYNTIVGTELDSSKGTYNLVMNWDSVLKHEGWLAAVEGDAALLKTYANIVFIEFSRKYDRLEGMAFLVRQNTPTDELRSLGVNYLEDYSNANGRDPLNYSSHFLRRISR